jgi:hypothetical protein
MLGGFLKRRFETVSEMHSNGVDHAPWFVRLDPSSGEGGVAVKLLVDLAAI